MDETGFKMKTEKTKSQKLLGEGQAAGKAEQRRLPWGPVYIRKNNGIGLLTIVGGHAKKKKKNGRKGFRPQKGNQRGQKERKVKGRKEWKKLGIVTPSKSQRKKGCLGKTASEAYDREEEEGNPLETSPRMQLGFPRGPVLSQNGGRQSGKWQTRPKL